MSQKERVAFIKGVASALSSRYVLSPTNKNTIGFLQSEQAVRMMKEYPATDDEVFIRLREETDLVGTKWRFNPCTNKFEIKTSRSNIWTANDGIKNVIPEFITSLSALVANPWGEVSVDEEATSILNKEITEVCKPK